jgi:hypothetical protein
VHELGAELDRDGDARVAGGEDAPADAVARLENGEPESRVAQGPRGGEPGGAGADDQDVHGGADG